VSGAAVAALAGCSLAADPWGDAQSMALSNLGTAYQQASRCLDLGVGDYRAADPNAPSHDPYCFRLDAKGVGASELEGAGKLDENGTWLLDSTQTTGGLRLDVVSVGYGAGIDGEIAADVVLMACWSAVIAGGPESGWAIQESPCELHILRAGRGIASTVALKEVQEHAADPTPGS
jgi:hypothetical protein